MDINGINCVSRYSRPIKTKAACSLHMCMLLSILNSVCLICSTSRGQIIKAKKSRKGYGLIAGGKEKINHRNQMVKCGKG